MFKKQLLATLAFCMMLAASYAQQNFTVQVIDKANKPLIGATVSVHKVNKQTNKEGFATFENISESKGSIKVSFLGYKDVFTNFPVPNSPLIITLEPTFIQTGEVYVYATRAKENSATTFKNLTKEDIKKENLGQDIPYLLDQTPGVVIGSDAGAGVGYTNMTIRGSDNQRINVTLNGIPLNDAESMGSFFVNLPDFASSMESVQIQRGIGTSTNGAGAFGASLNIQTDALEEKPYAELNNSIGSYNTWKNTIKSGTGLIDGKFAFNTRLSRIVSDGYIDKASSNLQSFYIDAGLYTQKHTLKATIFSGKEKTYQAWYGTPEPLLTGNKELLQKYANEALSLYEGPEYDRFLNADRKYNYYNYENQTDNYTQTHSHLQYTNIINHKLKFNSALHYTRGAGYYEEDRPNEKLAKYGLPDVIIGQETIKKSDLIRQRWLDNHFYGLTYSLDYKANNKWNFIFGGAFNQYRGDHYGKVIWSRYASNAELGDKYYFNDAQKNDFSMFAKTDFKTENWLINLDVQYRNVNYKAEGDDDKIKNINVKDNLNFFNPKVGATYFLNPNANMYISYAYASKEPVRKDYVENPRNEFPKPERMQDIEVGYRFRNETFNIGTNLYAMLYKDQLIPTGSLNDTGAELRFNIPKSHRIGLEIDGTWHICSQFTWAVTAALSDNKIFDFVEYYPVYDNDIDWNYIGEESKNIGDTKIAKSASTILSNNFTFKPLEQLSFSALSKYVSRLYLDNTSSESRSIDPSFVTNFRTSYSFTALGLKNIDAMLAVNNIFNSKYTTNGYTWGQKFQNRNDRDHYNFYYPQATTNFMFGLNIRF